MPDGGRKSRARSSAAIARDRAILVAGLQACDSVGLDDVSLTDVARRARLTSGATYARYENPRELLVDLWSQEVADEFPALVTSAINLTRDPASIRYLRSTFDPPTLHRRVMLAMLLASARIDELGELIPTQVRAQARSAGLGGNANAHGILSLAIGCAIYAPVEKPLTSGRRPTFARVAGAGPVDGPLPAPVRNREAPFNTGDPLRDRLLSATLQVVSKSGTHGVSLRRISRISGYDPTAVYLRYRTLQDLLDDVVDCATAVNMAPSVLAESLGEPDAVVARLRGWQGAQAVQRRRLNLEFHLTLMHDRALLQRFSDTDVKAYRAAARALAPNLSREAFVERCLLLRNLQTGASLLMDLGLASNVDWRPTVSAIFSN